MREISQNELFTISGGYIDTQGYDFSFVVENTAFGCLAGLALAAFSGGDASLVMGTAMIFGGYALAMMVAKTVDAVVFKPATTSYEPAVSFNTVSTEHIA